MGDPTFWDDPEKAQKTAQDVNSLKEEVDGFHKLSAGVDDLKLCRKWLPKKMMKACFLKWMSCWQMPQRAGAFGAGYAAQR